jgi:xanthine/CO dehydrogenase XdhC/CoxF family maturation factor
VDRDLVPGEVEVQEVGVQAVEAQAAEVQAAAEADQAVMVLTARHQMDLEVVEEVEEAQQ